MGVTTKTFRIQPAPATLTADLDTRELAVRKPASVDEILALAWNNTSAWRKGGDTAGTAVVLALTPMAGEDPSDPTTWTEDGAARSLVSAAGEGANVWTRPAAKLYKATLVGGATLDETAYFDLSDLELPPDPVERLAAIFGDKATVEMAPDGTVEVTLTDDLEEPLELPDDLGKVRINLNDHDLVGTDGDTESPDGTAAITIAKGEGLDAPTALELTGGDVTGGAGFSPAGGGVSGDGGPAILVADDATATVLVDADASVTGGKGGDSDTGDPGEGGLGVDPPEVLDPASEGTVAPGENGKDTAEAPTVNIVKALQRYPWNGKIDVDYTVRGAASRYDLVLTLAADGQSWTATAANLSGDVELTDGMTEANVKRVTWDAAADCGTAVVDRNATLTLTVKRVR